MPVVPFIPLIGQGIGAVGGAIGARNRGRAQQQQQAQTARMQAPLTARAGQLGRMGMPLVQQSGDYYSKLLRGDRSMLRSAMAPERAEITDTYRGAERSLSRSGVRGAQRDYAEGELARDRAGRLSMLAPAARAGAAGSAAALGANLTGQSSSIYSNLLSGDRTQQQINLDTRKYSDEQNAILGENIGKLITDFTKAWQNRGGGNFTQDAVNATAGAIRF